LSVLLTKSSGTGVFFPDLISLPLVFSDFCLLWLASSGYAEMSTEPNPVPKFRKAGFLNSCELIVCMWNKGHTWNFGKQSEMHNFFEGPICMGRERVKNPKHPTQKPVRLLKHLVNIATNQDDVVFDPFMGVGSTGVAAVEMGRKFIGVEIDEDYFEVAQKRLGEVQPDLLSSISNNGKGKETEVEEIEVHHLNLFRD